MQTALAVPSTNSVLNNQDRLDALYASGLMDSAPEEAFDRLTQLVCRLLHVPVSLVSLIDGKRQFFKSQTGTPKEMEGVRETALSHSFCQHVVIGNDILAIDDAPKHPLVHDNLAIPDLGVKAYLGIPIRTRDNHVLGALCAIDVQARTWTQEEKDTIEDLGALVMNEIALREEIAYRTKTEQRLELLTRELSHRIRNVFSLASGLVVLSARDDDAVKDFANKVSQRLNTLGAAQEFLQGHVIAATGSTLKDLINCLLAIYPQDQFIIDGDNIAIGESTATGFAFIVHELSTNAVKYGALSTTSGKIHITIKKQHDDVHVTWREQGGPAVSGPPVHKGFGSSLLERSTKIHLAGTALYDWAPEGVCVHIVAPEKNFAR